MLKDKTIIVTGASSGIGRQIAIECSREGANVVLLGRNIQELKNTFALLDNGNHLYFSIDITEYSKIETIIEETVKSLGQISGFVHSAGIEGTIPVNIMKTEGYESFFATNVISAFEICRILSKKKYLYPEGASFIFISSVMGVLGQPGKTAYCASKGALISGCRSLALELASKKIRVNCISPSIVETEMSKKLFNDLPSEAVQTIVDMHPLGLGKPEDVAYLCSFLLSDKAKWITGSNVIIDGGYSSK